ncbi:putative membrane protein, partial [Yersinia pestis PY-90]
MLLPVSFFLPLAFKWTI